MTKFGVLAYLGKSTADAFDIYFSKVLLAELKHKKPAVGWPYNFDMLQKEFVIPLREAERDALEEKLPVERGIKAEHLGQMVAIAERGFSKKTTIEAIYEYNMQLQTREAYAQHHRNI